MTKKELNNLPIGTIVYNGHAEGEIIADSAGKYIEVWIPINSMSDDSRYCDERPEFWEPMEDLITEGRL